MVKTLTTNALSYVPLYSSSLLTEGRLHCFGALSFSIFGRRSGTWKGFGIKLSCLESMLLVTRIKDQKKVHHSRCHRRFDLLLARIGRHCNNRHMPDQTSPFLELPNLSRTDEAVHHWHLEIHEDNIQKLPASIAFPHI